MTDAQRTTEATTFTRFSVSLVPNAGGEGRTVTVDEPNLFGVAVEDYATNELCGVDEYVDDITEEIVQRTEQVGAVSLLTFPTDAAAGQPLSGRTEPVRVVREAVLVEGGEPKAPLLAVRIEDVVAKTISMLVDAIRAEQARAAAAGAVSQGANQAIATIYQAGEALMFQTDREAKYVRCGGTRCPACDSNNVGGEEVYIETHRAEQECGCSDCGAAWTHYFLLSGYDHLRDENDCPID